MKKALLLVFFLSSSIHIHAQETPAQSCVRDLDAIPAFMLANDAGGKDEMAQKGQKRFDDALAAARADAAKIATDNECFAVLTKYLLAWRDGHLWAQYPAPKKAENAVPSTPQPGNHAVLKVLSEKTLLLTLPDFEATVGQDLEAMNAKQHDVLASHPNWIIDVRDNQGGFDDSYAPLLRWLMADDFTEVQVAYLVTAHNIQAQRELCAAFPTDTECPKVLGPIADRMSKAKTGEYVPESENGPLVFRRADRIEPHRPARVAVLIDHDCISSCEQFLLTVRQSFSVKLIGRHTYGMIDVSNVRPWTMPSGKHVLEYATTRSFRIPAMPVDGIGVMPDIYLPLGDGPNAKDDEVMRVENWLEGGSLVSVKN
jgi:hypothetical protein